MKFSHLPKIVRFLIAGIFVHMLILTLMRVIFRQVFTNPNDIIPYAVLLKAFYIGFKFDLRLVLLIFLPLLLFAWIKPFALFGTSLGRGLWKGFLTISFIAVFLSYVTDFGYYAYIETRLDSTILRFFYNPKVAYEMVMETYPVYWLMAILGLFVSIYWIILGKIIKKIHSGKTTAIKKWKKIAVVCLFVFVYFFGIYGKFSFYPLRWSDAFFSAYSFASALALNPVLFFIDTFKNKDVTYDVAEVKKHYDTISDFLGIKDKDKDTLNFIRINDGDSELPGKPNIVIVILESFAYYKTGLSENPLDPTPNFDALAKDGILFTRFYAPHGGTARSVFTAVTGIPDVEMTKTSSRNPLVVDQHTIINAFKGYEKLYFLGGSASWGEIRGLLSHNIENLQIFEEGSYTSPRTDVWGISDMDLFMEANKVLAKKTEKPFFAIIQTSGNHEPFTIPEDSKGFKSIEADKEAVKKYGFKSVSAFNSFRFMDHSIGIFMDTAKKSGYFNNTVFVFFGDHGLIRNATHMHKSEDQLLLTRYHVPFLIYEPSKIKKSATFNKVASEVDVLPTIAAFSGIPHVNSTFGKDLLDPGYDEQRYAFTIKHKHGPELGLIGDQFYFFINADKTKRRLHRIYANVPRKNVIKKYPEVAKKMEQLCLGIYETAKYIRSHNSPAHVTEMVKEH